MSDENDDEGDDVGPEQDLSSPEAADRDDDPVAAGGNDDDDAPAPKMRGERSYSSATRAAFAKAQESMRSQLKDQESEYDEDYPVETPAKPAAPANPAEGAAGGPKPQGGQTTPSLTAPVAPPAPSLDPAVVQLREQWTAKLGELDKREQEFAARESAANEDAVHESYLERSAQTTIDFIKKHSGAQTESELAEEVTDLIVAMSSLVNKTAMDPVLQARLDSRQTLRYVKHQKSALAKREESTQKQQAALQQRAEVQRAQEFIGKAITAPEAAKQYPFLAVEDNAGEIVFEVIEAQFRKDGTTLAWTEAAKRANEYLHKQSSAHYDRRKHLLEAPRDTRDGQANANGAPGDPSGIRRSRAITNAATTPAPPTPPAPTSGKWDPEEHRANTKRSMKQAVKAALAAESADE
ncbi:MAG: hypothetical protein ACREJC_09750 [Tepidisphaeraceae bacterium]